MLPWRTIRQMNENQTFYVKTFLLSAGYLHLVFDQTEAVIWSTFWLNKKENKTQLIHIMCVCVFNRNFPLWISCLFIMISKMLFLSPSLFSIPTTPFSTLPVLSMLGSYSKFRKFQWFRELYIHAGQSLVVSLGRAFLESPPPSGHGTWFFELSWVQS